MYNEALTIQKIIEKVQRIDIKGINKEIIIVDDGSIDGTTQILKQIKEDNITILYHQHNHGKGSAIRTALAKITGEVIIIQDADLEYNPHDYIKLIAPILKGNYKIVYGSRFLNSNLKISGKQRTKMPIHYVGNKVLSSFLNLIYSTRITDPETGYKAFRSEVLENISLKAKRFEFEPEITAKAIKKGYKILEVPINYYPRSFKEGKKITWLDGLKAIYFLLKYRFSD